jgi:hypothetical protein
MRPVNATGAKRGMIGRHNRAKPAVARKPARNGADFKEIAPRDTDRRPHGGFRRIENCVPSAI